jgi:hypothetical protein
MQSDPFEPRHEPARSIYLAFQAEAAKRPGRSVEQWQEAEITAVYVEANRQSDMLDLRPVTRDQVERAETYARGSIDYGLTWALQVVREMQGRAG